MPDTYTLHLQNFRSIRDARVEIAPLTVVYGPNGSGKSSLIYGLLTLKEFPDQPQSKPVQPVFLPVNQPGRVAGSGASSRCGQECVPLHRRLQSGGPFF